MVRLVDKNDVNRMADLVTGFFSFQKYFTHIAPVNHPDVSNCLYAMCIIINVVFMAYLINTIQM